MVEGNVPFNEVIGRTMAVQLSY